eukprot:scaffold120663_cov36-Tisochrysis_lutea.AAC.3
MVQARAIRSASRRSTCQASAAVRHACCFVELAPPASSAVKASEVSRRGTGLGARAGSGSRPIPTNTSHLIDELVGARVEGIKEPEGGNVLSTCGR